MNAADMRSLVHRAVDAMNRRALNELDDLVATDFVRHCEATPGPVRSLADYKAFLRDFDTGFPDNVQTVKLLAAEEDLIGVYVTYEGTHLGPFGGIPPTGKHIKFDFAGMFKVRDGKLAEFWITWDNVTILTQLGLMPAGDATAAT
jgi:steroid delta-isomerase-like uncharacterized protein